MTLATHTKVYDLLKAHPFLEDFLVSYNPKFGMLKNKTARATIGRVATLRTAAGMAGIDLESFLAAIASEIEGKTGKRPEVEGAVEGTEWTRAKRMDALKAIITDLHEGGDLKQARARFREAIQDVEASEIAEMEESLIRGGLPVSEVERLCDVHVGAFKQALDEHETVTAPPGHPIHTYMEDNRIITQLANQLGAVARAVGANERVRESFIGAEHVCAVRFGEPLSAKGEPTVSSARAPRRDRAVQGHVGGARSNSRGNQERARGNREERCGIFLECSDGPCEGYCRNGLQRGENPLSTVVGNPRRGGVDRSTSRRE